MDIPKAEKSRIKINDTIKPITGIKEIIDENTKPIEIGNRPNTQGVSPSKYFPFPPSVTIISFITQPIKMVDAIPIRNTVINTDVAVISQ